MTQIGISDISKNPSIIDKLDDIAEIVNKKTKKVKGVFIPSDMLLRYRGLIDELEYRKFVERNSNLISEDEDDTLLDGLEDEH